MLILGDTNSALTAISAKRLKVPIFHMEAGNRDWSVRRAFTAQIIINHIQARDDEHIDNMDQELDRAVANSVKNLVV